MPFLDYELPADRIAQTPAEPRDSARLLVVDRATQRISHHSVRELPDLLAPGDLIILNDTRVLHARLRGHRAGTGGRWEGLFLQESDGVWELLSQTRGTLRAGETIIIEPGSLRLALLHKAEGHWFARPSEAGPASATLERFGEVPLPPYIRKGRAADNDNERYQTTYARTPGAVAAPTAGLHFTPELFARLRDRDIDTAFVTLHVGLGTFQPLPSGDYTEHTMHAEWCQLPAVTADAIRRCRERGGRVVAIGTTTARTLESAARASADERCPQAWEGATRLFLHPPDRFRCVDALLTNFHLPRTTLLLMVAALAGEELLERAYGIAIEAGYRFYSYGDAMLVV